MTAILRSRTQAKFVAAGTKSPGQRTGGEKVLRARRLLGNLAHKLESANRGAAASLREGWLDE